MVALLLLFSFLLPQVALAEPAEEEKTETVEEVPLVDSQGRPILADREAAILVDLNTGTILYDKDSDKQMYPASTTKIMTALLVLEAVESGSLSLDDIVTVTEEMLNDLPYDGSSMYLEKDEQISVKNLLEGLLIISGNDAAHALAFAVSGSVESFVNQMNTRASELGANDTHFVNPHGLHDDNHYTTATDLAKITREAMKNDTFREIVATGHIKIPATNLTEDRYFINTNGLISAMRYREYYYKKSIGVKTGYTDEAGNCLVSAAQDGQFTLLCVLLNAEGSNVSHNDSIRLLDYGFSNYRAATAIPKGRMLGEVKVKQGAKGVDFVTLSTAENLIVTLPTDVSTDELTVTVDTPDAVYAPIQAGTPLATVTVYYEGSELGSAELVADTNVKRHMLWFLMALWEKIWGFTPFRVICYILIAGVIGYIALVIDAFRRELKRAKRYRRHR